MTISGRTTAGPEEKFSGQNKAALSAFGTPAVYLRWGGTRNRADDVAKAFGAELIALAWHTKTPWLAPIRYLVQFGQTLVILIRRRPSVVFSQHTQPFCSLAAIVYAMVAGCRVVTDCHNGAFTDERWQRWPFSWLNQCVYRHATLNIVHNEEILEHARKTYHVGNRFIVLHDPIPDFSRSHPVSVSGGYVLVIGSFDDDEPVSEVLEAASLTPDLHYVLTGNANRLDRNLRMKAGENVCFPGFLPNADYDDLLGRSCVVVALSRRKNVLMRAMHEAIGAGVPLVTSETAVARAYLSTGTVFVQNDAEDIARGVREALGQRDRLRREMRSLAALRRGLWQWELEGVCRALETEPF